MSAQNLHQRANISQQVAGSLAALYISICGGLLAPLPAEALLSSPNAQIARSVDAALRRAIPVANTDVRSIQTKLEVRQHTHHACSCQVAGAMLVDTRMHACSLTTAGFATHPQVVARLCPDRGLVRCVGNPIQATDSAAQGMGEHCG